MSYDLMVLDKHKRFITHEEFRNWYEDQMECQGDIDYNDYRHSTPSLQSWFLEMKDIVRPLNGEFAPSVDELNSGDYHEADYSIGKDYIYVAFAWSDSERIYPLVMELAQKHDVAFFDASGSGDVIYPDGTILKTQPESQESIETEFMKNILRNMKDQESQPPKSTFDKERKRRNWIGMGIFVLYSIVFIGVSCILIQTDSFRSFGRYLCIAWLIGAFVLFYYLSEWKY